MLRKWTQRKIIVPSPGQKEQIVKDIIPEMVRVITQEFGEESPVGGEIVQKLKQIGIALNKTIGGDTARRFFQVSPSTRLGTEGVARGKIDRGVSDFGDVFEELSGQAGSAVDDIVGAAK